MSYQQVSMNKNMAHKVINIVFFVLTTHLICACPTNVTKVSCEQKVNNSLKNIESNSSSVATMGMVSEAFNQHRHSIHKIYNTYKDQNLVGNAKLKLIFIINDKGKALNCRVSENNSDCIQFGNDICNEIEKIKFKDNIAIGNEQVIYPIDFIK